MVDYPPIPWIVCPTDLSGWSADQYLAQKSKCLESLKTWATASVSAIRSHHNSFQSKQSSYEEYITFCSLCQIEEFFKKQGTIIAQSTVHTANMVGDWVGQRGGQWPTRSCQVTHYYWSAIGDLARFYWCDEGPMRRGHVASSKATTCPSPKVAYQCIVVKVYGRSKKSNPRPRLHSSKVIPLHHNFVS